MKPYTKLGDEALKFPRVVGRRRMSSKLRKAAIVARVAPEEMDGQPEERIHDLVEIEIEATGLPYLSLRTRFYNWLKRHADRGDHIAMEMQGALSDLPDIMVWDKSKDGRGTVCLCLELKRDKGTASKGQRAFAEKVGGEITKSFAQAQAAVRRFTQ